MQAPILLHEWRNAEWEQQINVKHTQYLNKDFQRHALVSCSIFLFLICRLMQLSRAVISSADRNTISFHFSIASVTNLGARWGPDVPFAVDGFGGARLPVSRDLMGLNDTFWPNHVILTGCNTGTCINTGTSTNSQIWMETQVSHWNLDDWGTEKMCKTGGSISVNKHHWHHNKTEREKMETSEMKTWRGRGRKQRQKEREGVYLQGRGGGTPKSAKSGSEKRAEEEGWRSFLIHDYKIRILTETKTTGRNKAPRHFLLRKLQIAPAAELFYLPIPRW